MRIEVKKSDRKNPPEGLHAARLIQILDLGTQKNELYNKKEERVRLVWELLNCKFETEEGEEVSHIVGKEYSAKLSRKSHLRKAVEAMLGKPLVDGAQFSLETIAGAACQVQVIHKNGSGKNAHEVYANVDAVLPAGLDAKGKPMKYAQPSRDIVIFDINNIDDEILKNLPEFIQDTIMKSDEYEEYTAGAYQAKVEGKGKKAPAKAAKAAPTKSAKRGK